MGIKNCHCVKDFLSVNIYLATQVESTQPQISSKMANGNFLIKLLLPLLLANSIHGLPRRNDITTDQAAQVKYVIDTLKELSKEVKESDDRKAVAGIKESLAGAQVALQLLNSHDQMSNSNMPRDLGAAVTNILQQATEPKNPQFETALGQFQEYLEDRISSNNIAEQVNVGSTGRAEGSQNKTKQLATIDSIAQLFNNVIKHKEVLEEGDTESLPASPPKIYQLDVKDITGFNSSVIPSKVNRPFINKVVLQSPPVPEKPVIEDDEEDKAAASSTTPTLIGDSASQENETHFSANPSDLSLSEYVQNIVSGKGIGNSIQSLTNTFEINNQSPNPDPKSGISNLQLGGVNGVSNVYTPLNSIPPNYSPILQNLEYNPNQTLVNYPPVPVNPVASYVNVPLGNGNVVPQYQNANITGQHNPFAGQQPPVDPSAVAGPNEEDEDDEDDEDEEYVIAKKE